MKDTVQEVLFVDLKPSRKITIILTNNIKYVKKKIIIEHFRNIWRIKIL